MIIQRFINILILTIALLAAAISVNAQSSFRPVISDLPPLINQTNPAIDLFLDSAPADKTILLVCKQFSATCAVGGSSNHKVGYVCSGDSRNCWRRFIGTLTEIGIKVLVSPGSGGASYSFILGGDGAARDFIDEELDE